MKDCVGAAVVDVVDTCVGTVVVAIDSASVGVLVADVISDIVGTAVVDFVGIGVGAVVAKINWLRVGAVVGVAIITSFAVDGFVDCTDTGRAVGAANTVDWAYPVYVAYWNMKLLAEQKPDSTLKGVDRVPEHWSFG